jgi:hypothetical protein
MERRMEQEYREEAARLKLTPRAEQRAVVQWLRDIAADSSLSNDDRQLADERANALAKLLFAGQAKPRKSKQ